MFTAFFLSRLGNRERMTSQKMKLLCFTTLLGWIGLKVFLTSFIEIVQNSNMLNTYVLKREHWRYFLVSCKNTAMDNAFGWCFLSKDLVTVFQTKWKHNIFTISGVHSINIWLVLWMSHAIIVSGTESKMFIEKDNPHTEGCRNM